MAANRRLSFPFLALISCIAIISATAAIVYKQVNLTTFGSLSNSQHTIYITGTTLLATLLSALVGAQIRNLFLRELDAELCQIGTNSQKSTLSFPNRRWRSILRIGTPAERIQNIPIGLA